MLELHILHIRYLFFFTIWIVLMATATISLVYLNVSIYIYIYIYVTELFPYNRQCIRYSLLSPSNFYFHSQQNEILHTTKSLQFYDKRPFFGSVRFNSSGVNCIRPIFPSHRFSFHQFKTMPFSALNELVQYIK